MIYFQKITIYQKARSFNKDLYLELKNISNLSLSTKDQIDRASLSIVLNIAVGCGKQITKSQKNFYSIARGSVFECGAALEYLYDTGKIRKEILDKLHNDLEEISKMLYKLILSK